MMNALYSLYDALVAINVSSERARAVVDAMEHEMGSVLSTKADLAATQLLLKKDIDSNYALLKQEIAAVQTSLKQEIVAVHASLKQEIASAYTSLHAEIGALRDSLRADIRAQQQSTDQRFDALLVLMRSERESLQHAMTVRMGSITVAGVGLLLAGARLMF